MNNQLCRSKRNRRLAGVCGGLGEYFRIDPTIMRILWIIFAFAFGVGVLAYIVAAIVIPEEKRNTGRQDNVVDEIDVIDDYSKASYDPRKNSVILGTILMFVGALALIHRYVKWIDFNMIWPACLIMLGMLVILTAPKKPKS